MMSVALAFELREAGLRWTPVDGDWFTMLGSDLTGQRFVISAQMVVVQELNGEPALLVHGSPEWALDHLPQADAVWLPREDQLREALAARLPDGPLRLERTGGGYRCTTALGSTRGGDACEAYGRALLQALG